MKEARATADVVARRSYGKLVAWLAARGGDLASAEDALADAFAAALVAWPKSLPDNPEAWLAAAARRRLIDAGRRGRTARDARPTLALAQETLEHADDGDIPDRRLALMFVCAHPAIDPGVRAPLILQTTLGFDAAAIGSAFLVSPAAMAQRLVRAKTKIAQARIPFVIPGRADMPGRLDAVLDAIYASFAAGWRDLQADGRSLGDEALWLGRLVAELAPDEPEANGLVALMLHADARRAARRTSEGAYAPLGEQDVSLWNAPAIAEAEARLRAAAAQGRAGRFQIEAAIQSAHAERRLSGRTDWRAILRLYDWLGTLAPSPVVGVNRAVALAHVEGASAGLAALDAVARDGRLEAYQPYWATRAELLARGGATESAREAYNLAIGLERDEAVRRFLLAKRAALT